MEEISATYLIRHGPIKRNPQRMKLLDIVANNLDRYNWLGIPFPGYDDWEIGATETFTGVIKVKPKSLLVSLTGYCSLDSGFMFSLYDKAANFWLVQNEYDWWRNQVGQMTDKLGSGQRWFDIPYPVTGDGELQISVTNLSKTNSAKIQVMLQVAERGD